MEMDVFLGDGCQRRSDENENCIWSKSGTWWSDVYTGNFLLSIKCSIFAFALLCFIMILNRVNWQRMGTGWTSWGQTFGDIRCEEKRKLCNKLIDNPRDGWRRQKGELLEVRQVHWAVEAMAMAVVQGGLQCQMKLRAWAGELSFSNPDTD